LTLGNHTAISEPPRSHSIHPGEILADELVEIGVTPTELARQIKVPPNRLSQIINGKRAISGDTALRLGHWFGMHPQFWLNLQSAHDLAVARAAVAAEVAHLPRRGAA
jgi:addiction module HigA family antidote